MPLLKKNDTQDALKREGNTTHIDVFAAPDLGRFFWPGPACTLWRRRSGASAAIKPLLIAANTGDRRKLCDFFRCCCWQCRRRCSSATGCHESGREIREFSVTTDGKRGLRLPSCANDQAKVSTRPLPLAGTGTWLTWTAASAMSTWLDWRAPLL